ncbi:MAG: hypothetical protein ACLFQA_00305 [Bacteroidales bacterium]
MKRVCHKAFPPVESVDTLIKVDTITKPVYVEIELPADTVRLTDTVYIDTTKSFIDTLQTEFALSLCGWDADKLVHELQMKEAVLGDTVYVDLFNESHTITITKIHEVAVLPWWVVPVIIFLGLIIGLLAFRLVF